MISILKNKNRKLILVISFLTVLISFKSSNQWSDFPIGNELFWWVVQIVFLVILLNIKKNISNPQIEKNYLIIKLYLFWVVICIVRGIFVADNYWEWKMLLIISFFLLIPFLVYITNSPLSLQLIVKTWFKYALYIYILFSPFIWGDGVGKFLVPISFLLIFFSILNYKWKVIALIVTIYVITFDITARGNVLKFLIPFLIGHLYYIRKLLTHKVLNVSRLLMLIVPFVLLFLAIFNIFNIFKISDYIGDYETKSNVRNEGYGEQESLTGDSRTFLYEEVISSALRHEYVIFGRTPARGNDSAIFGDFNKEVLHTGKTERFANEVSILNFFTWLGSFGVLLYFLVFFKATYLAINQSNNFFMKLVGINVAFRWVYGWAEDFSEFDLSTIFLWIMIGMCFSESFRKMSDREFKNWVNGIFAKNNKKVQLASCKIQSYNSTSFNDK